MIIKPSQFYYRIHNACYERYLNIRTRGIARSTKMDGYEYATISYQSIFKILRYLRLTSSDCFVDVGCGKGRVVCCAATMPLRNVFGVEFDRALAGAATQNLSNLRRRRSKAQIIQSAAEDMTYDSATVLYLFNPFGENTMADFLGALNEKSKSLPNRRIVYVNPKHSHVLKNFGYEAYDHWKRSQGIVEHDVIFYKFVRH